MNGGALEMKKLLSCAALVCGVVGAVKYLNKYGLPILGNLTMYIPFKFRYDFWDGFTKGIEFAEEFTK